MVVRCYWPDCDYRGKRWGATPIDAFWVEATQVEADSKVFPRLPPATVAESRKLAKEFRGLAERMRQPALPFCFLVARDLSSIDPFHVHYPIHQMWNAYSPFQEMTEMVVAELDEVRGLVAPSVHVGKVENPVITLGA